MQRPAQLCHTNLGSHGEVAYARCHGSLPLKKRRIMLNSGSWSASKIPVVDINSKNSIDNAGKKNNPDSRKKRTSMSLASDTSGSNFNMNLPPQNSEMSDDSNKIQFAGHHEDDNLAALALVAARAASASAPTDTVGSSRKPNTSYNSFQQVPSTCPTVVTMDKTLVVSNVGATNTSKQRIHHPPLCEPLPNGCHGRTSRNNSYCRRHPCYNGSKYCKLHYQQYVLNKHNGNDVGVGTEATNNASSSEKKLNGCTANDACLDASAQQQVNTSTSNQIEAAKIMARQIALSCSSTDALLSMYKSATGKNFVPANTNIKNNSTSSNSRHGSHHQDKKFSNLRGEVPCRATTTRGRPCAYIAVNDTPYCHLHSEYGTNPPTPRRGAQHRDNLALQKRIQANSKAAPKPTPSVINTINHSSSMIPNFPMLKLSVNDAITSKHGKHVLETDLKSQATYEVKAQSMISFRDNQNGTLVNMSVNGEQSVSVESGPVKIIANSLHSNAQQNENKKLHAKSMPSEQKIKSNSMLPPPGVTLPRGNSNAILEVKGLKLLNSVDSSLWQNIRVRIMIGPFAGHTGRVVRWGNGWVTLRTYAGLHNRRAFELSTLPNVLDESIDYGLLDEPDEKFWSDISIPDGYVNGEKTKSENQQQSSEAKVSREINLANCTKKSEIAGIILNNLKPTASPTMIQSPESKLKTGGIASPNLPHVMKQPVSLGDLASLFTDGTYTPHSAALAFGRRAELLFGTAVSDMTQCSTIKKSESVIEREPIVLSPPLENEDRVTNGFTSQGGHLKPTETDKISGNSAFSEGRELP